MRKRITIAVGIAGWLFMTGYGISLIVEGLRERQIRDRPPSTGYVKSRKATSLFGIGLCERSIFVIEVAESGEEVRAVTGIYILDRVPDEVRFYYSGDPSREVFLLDHEEDPLWIGMISTVVINILPVLWVYSRLRPHTAERGLKKTRPPGSSQQAKSMASRFDDKVYEQLFIRTLGKDDNWTVKSSLCHSRQKVKGLNRHEKYLWDRRGTVTKLAIGFLALTIIIGLAGKWMLPSRDSDRPPLEALLRLLPLLLLLLAWLLCGLSAFAMLIIAPIRSFFFRRRTPVSVSEFTQALPSGPQLSAGYVQAFRRAVGFAYQVPPETIRTDDDPKTLRPLTLTWVSCPYVFEIVLGAARLLMIHLTDEDVDRIVGRIQQQAASVGDLVAVLCPELTECQKQMELAARSAGRSEPQTHRINDEPFDLRKVDWDYILEHVAPNTPAGRYGKLAMESAVKDLHRTFIYKAAEPLPHIEGYTDDLVPFFGEFVLKLKKSAQMEPTFSYVPQRAVVEFTAGKDPVDLHIEFCDHPSSGYVKMHAEPARDDLPLTPP